MEAQQPPTPDPFIAEIAAKLDRAAKIGQRILAPFLYLACVAIGVIFTIDGVWISGAIVGLVIGWVLVQLSYYPIKWALVVLGVFAVGSAL